MIIQWENTMGESWGDPSFTWSKQYHEGQKEHGNGKFIIYGDDWRMVNMALFHTRIGK